MNAKGLKLNKYIISKINEMPESITIDDLKGLDTFNDFSWNGFSLLEFNNLISLFSYLDSENLFMNVDSFHPFIFNYSNEITEMDIITVLSDGEAKVMLDIELKNGENVSELKEKITEQINKRVTDYMPQFLKNKRYIATGFVNNDFVCGTYFDGETANEIIGFSALASLLSFLKQSDEWEEYLVQTANLASIVKVCNDIKSGTYRYYEDTNRAFNSIIGKIENCDACFVYGNAGTGKSILALRLFFEMLDTKILLLNSKLYFSLGLKDYYKTKRATFNTSEFLDMIDSKTISIIDECQRITVDDMVKIIKKSRFTFLFGDHRQAFYKRSTLLTCKDLAKELETNYLLKVSYRIMKKAKRYSDEVDNALNLLTCIKPNVTKCKLPNDYQINLFYDEQSFLNAYEKSTGIKKIYVPLNESPFNIKIGNKTFERVRYDYDTFSISSIEGNYYGTTYHALSFDIDHCFVCLKTTELISFSKSKVLFYKNRWIAKPTYVDIQLYLNELNILFTRGKKSLNIYVQDIKTYLYFSRLVNKIR